jgi:hypothetical protein
MRRWWLLPVLFLALPACGGGEAIPAEYLQIRVEVEASEVVLGTAFPLEVVRIWQQDLEPDPFDGEALAPLVLRHVETVRRENERQVEERTRFRAYAFTPGTLIVPGPDLVAGPKGGGKKLLVSGNRIELTVKPSLDPSAPGEAELPGDLLPPESGRTWWIEGATAALTLLLVYLEIRRRRAKRAAESAAVESRPRPVRPSELALQALAELAARAPDGPGETDAFYREASGILRRYLGGRFDLPTGEMTTEEVLHAGILRRAECEAPRALLRRALRDCDLVKFARHRPGAPERKRTLDSARRFVVETARGEET